MKYSRILAMVGIATILILFELFWPTEEEQEAAKMKELVNRNEIEKQLVGKWNHSDFPAGLKNNRNYHLLSADAGYFYRGSDKTKTHGGNWSVQITDSVLYLNIYPVSNSKVYKIKNIKANYVLLQKIENDSLTRLIHWFRHP